MPRLSSPHGAGRPGAAPRGTARLVHACGRVVSGPGVRARPRAVRIRLRRAVGMEQDLRPAVVAAVEVLVSLGRLVELEVVGDDERGLRLARVDQVAQVPVVALHGALTRAHLLPAEPEVAEVE